MITLGEYMSFIYGEMTRARQHADATSIEIAKGYAKDELLRHFSVPRFRIPEMELTIPVLVADANYDNEYAFKISQEEFNTQYRNELVRSFASLYSERELKIDEKALQRLEKLYKEISEVVLKQSLTSYDALRREVLARVAQGVPDITDAVLSGSQKLEEYVRKFPAKEHYGSIVKGFGAFVEFNIKVAKSSLTGLLINPETAAVRDGGNATSLFQIKAKITEEGIFINSVKDANGRESFTVDFE